MFLANFLQDLRIGLRVLIREKSFCALAVTVLALGICAVTTQFSVVNGVMLRGFSYPNADRLVNVQFIDPSQTNFFGVASQVFSQDFIDAQEAQTSLEFMAAYINGSTVNMTIGRDAQRFTGAYITENFFRTLGVAPVVGRDFTADDNKPGAPKVTIIGHAMWQRDFGGDAGVVGRTVRLNGRPATVVGVMPDGFAFPNNEQLWIPLFNEFEPQPRNVAAAPGNTVNVLAALKPEVTLDQANLEFNALAKRLAETHPETNKLFASALIEPLIDSFIPVQVKTLLAAMLAICVGVLLLACVNVMNMQFARATLRAKELAIRSSLGASRSRLVLQMLTESLLVASIGATAGVAAAFWAVDSLTNAIRGLNNPIPAYISFDIDGPVLVFTVAATVLAAVVSGLVPALMSSRTRTADVLRESGRGNSGRAVNLITRGLVVFQIGITCVLLTMSLLQVRSIVNQQTLDYGYDTDGILAARMGLMDGDYPTSESRKLFHDRLVLQLRANPAVEAAALTTRFRMTFAGNTPVELDGQTYQDDRDRPNTNLEAVTDGYFAVTGQRVLEGRDFTADDLDTRQPVAIVNASFARKHFGLESALGRRFRTSVNGGTSFGPWRTIVGVVSDVRMQGPFNVPNTDASGFYVPLHANAFAALEEGEVFAPQFATILLKPHGGPGARHGESLLGVMREEIRAADPNLPLYFVETPRQGQDAFIAQNRIIATMFAVFGLVAMLLASVGLYGVTAFAVNQRAQEFGIRMALGAEPRGVMRMVLAQGGWQLVIGLAGGLGFAALGVLLAGSQIQNFLFDVNPGDPVTYSLVAGVLALVSLIATIVPALRATRVDPMIVLRSE